MHPGLPEGKLALLLEGGVGAGSSPWWFVTSLCSLRWTKERHSSSLYRAQSPTQGSLVSSTLVRVQNPLPGKQGALSTLYP